MYGHNSTKLHILSPISDKSSLEPCSETSDNNRNNNSERTSPEPGGPGGDCTPTGSATGPHGGTSGGSTAGTPTGKAPSSIGLSLNLSADQHSAGKNSRSRRTPNNRNLIALSFHGVQAVHNANNMVSVCVRRGGTLAFA